ncbi:MAG: hypothetical protein ACK5X3_23290, partial [Pseudomonadota bacterium]
GMRGSSALEGAGDAVIHLKRLEGKIVEIGSDKMKDGEEFKPIILSLEKVEWIDERDPLGKPRSTLVPQMVGEDRSLPFPNDVAVGAILREVDLAWKAGNPYSMAPQRRQQQRYLPVWVARTFSLKEEVARDYCEEMIHHNTIYNDTYKDENRNIKKGLRLADFVEEEAYNGEEI